MKHYILLQRITGSGGVQCYVTAMSRYLEKNGWHVVVISDNNPHNDNERCVIKDLERFRKDGNPFTLLHPHQIPRLFVSFVLSQMIRTIGPISPEEEVIIESWNSQTAMWGEVLAKKIKGRHIFWTANEKYRGADRAYESKIDFFSFKMDRGEVFATIATANRLFEGFRTYKQGDFLECLINEDPVQDIDCEEVNCIIKKDWNIGYIGRTRKSYVSNIIDGISIFAEKHPDKTIQFIIVGDANPCRAKLNSITQNNLSVIELGDQYPIPRKLFSVIDVAIAGSGAARHSADEGVLTIVADTETCDSRGLLGYDSMFSTFATDKQTDTDIHYPFSLALERALVMETWKGVSNKWIPSPSISECWKNHEMIIKLAASDLYYYDEKKLLCGKINFRDFFRIIYRDIKARFHFFRV